MNINWRQMARMKRCVPLLFCVVAILQTWASSYVAIDFPLKYSANVWIQNSDEIDEYLKSELTSLTYERYEKLSFSDSERAIFYQDIKNSFEFRSLINGNPKFIEVYHRCISSDFRTDIHILRYIGFRSSIFVEDLPNYTGDKLSLKKEGYTNYFYNQNGKVGTLSRSIKQNKYIIQICNNQENYLENLFPLPNCKYIKSTKYYNYTVETNKDGQKTLIEATCHGYAGWERDYEENKKRKQNLISKFKHAMNGVNTDGIPISVYATAPDESGHLIPHQWGGNSLDVGLNLVPQDSSLNHDPKWLKYENDGKEILMKGGKIKLRIKLDYPPKHMRPTKITRYQVNNGEVVCDNEVFDNCLHLRNSGKGILEKVKEMFVNLF